MKIIESLCLIFSFFGAMFFSRLKGKKEIIKKYEEQTKQIKKENEQIKQDISNTDFIDRSNQLLDKLTKNNNS
ncbi:MAG: hypothetical protein ACO25K_05170 [Candidatus Fonsibacter ubiquis]